MKLATTTSDFERYLKGHQERVDCVLDAGFKYIDLGMYIVNEDDELIMSDNWSDNAKKLLENAQKRGGSFVQAHSPNGNPLSDDPKHVEELLRRTIRSIDVCGILGIKNIVVHAGENHGVTKEDFFKRNKAFYELLFPAMERNNVNVLVENSTKFNQGDMYYTNSGADMKEMVEFVNHPLFHACWDTGHGNCEGPQYDEIVTIGSDLYALHVNDNRACGDEHNIPYLGTMNMDEIMHALIDIGFNGYFTFESCLGLRPSTLWLGERRRFEKDTRLLEPSLEIQKSFEKLIYTTGKYILEQYDCFEE